MSLPIRPNILDMQPYSPGKPLDEVKRELGISEVIKLASNENPYGPSPKAKRALEQAIGTLHLYPDASAFELKAAISKSFQIDPSYIVVGNGSDEIIHYLGLIFLSGQDDNIVVIDPSFVRYDCAAQIADSKIIKVEVDSMYEVSLGSVLAAINSNTKLVFLANPNNPTGTIFDKEAFDSFIQSVPKGVVVVLDEAYFEYAENDPRFPNGLDYLKAGHQVVVLRTMSKAYGLAGLRLGFGFAHPEIIDAINRVRAPFNTNSLAQVAAVAALADTDFVEMVKVQNKMQMSRVEKALANAGGRPVKSHANFVLAEFDGPTKSIFDGLLKRGVIVRGGHQLGLPNTLRVSIGTEKEVDIFKSALENVMEDLIKK